jgi:tetratricopeptide (TPR) repeat protein
MTMVLVVDIMGMNNSVFISYRREAAAFIARAVFQNLRTHDIDAFMDVESINQGQFDKIILNQIAARPYFLPILAKGTLERCVDPNDWVRREIEHAMATNRIIVPLRVPPFSFAEGERYLPDNLKGLLRYNAVDIPFDYFDEAMERLRERFLIPVDMTTLIIPDDEQAVVAAKIKRATQDEASKEDLIMAQIGQQAAEATTVSAALPDPAPAAEAASPASPASPDDPDVKTVSGFISPLQSKLAQGFIAYTQGLNAERTNNLLDALKSYSKAISLNGAFTVAYFARGRLRRLMGDLDGAVEDLTEALTFQPRYDEAYAERGLAQQAMGKLEAALRDLDDSLRINPRRPDVYYARGQVRLEMGDVPGAISDFNMVLELDPDHAQAAEIQGLIAKHA